MGSDDTDVVVLDDTLDLLAFHRVAAGARLKVPDRAWARIDTSAKRLADLLDAHPPTAVYGVTTRYGARNGTPVPPVVRANFQLETLRSHACGTGPLLTWAEGRGVWLAKLASVATGLTGASAGLARSLTELLNAGLAPAVPATGSLGASGDLIPSAHAGLPLVGEGHVLRADGSTAPAGRALGDAGISPNYLGPRDGLSLVNGTAVTLSLAVHACISASRLTAAAEWLAAPGLEAIGGHRAAFSQPIADARPHRGVADACASVRAALVGVDPNRLDRVGVHDPYAWRCLPQIHGAARSACAWAVDACQDELVGCSDNPIVGDDGTIYSGGNFHGAPLGLTMEALRLGMAAVCGLSRQRIAQLASRLEHAGGAGPGLTMVLTTATASLLEIGSIGTATGHWLPVDGVEDHVSNATLAARRAQNVVAGGWFIAAAEAVAVAQLLTPPPTSAGARWVQGLLDDLQMPIRLDLPLSDTLTALAQALPMAASTLF